MLTTTYVPGAPNWAELGTPDVEGAVAFYRALFGWQFQPVGSEADGYGLLQHDGKTVAAIGRLTEESASSSWMLCFQTVDAEATARAVEAAGGSVRVAPTDVSTAGRMARFADPTDADFGVWQPGDTEGLDAVTDPNTLCWTELYTTDAAAAAEFYRTVFGWETAVFEWRTEATPGGVAYTVVSAPAGGPDDSHGGILQLPSEDVASGSTSHWHPYFEVPDCDAVFASATERGATALIPPMEADRVGRFAMFTDPYGALLAVITGS